MKKNYILVWVVMIGFFAVSFVTNILGPIMPKATTDLHLSLAQVGVLPFAFFIAYTISIPAGYMLDKFGSKIVIMSAFAIGTMIFCTHADYNSHD